MRHCLIFFFLCAAAPLITRAGGPGGKTTMPLQPALCHPSSDQSFLISGPGRRWWMKRADKVKDGGDVVSGSYNEGGEWLKAIVPGTVLTSLVADGIYPDPYFGDNNRRKRHVIPDMADSGREFYHYWFRTSFDIPASLSGRRIWLRLHGVNYRAAIWLNGKKVGNIAGMFVSPLFDITEIVQRQKKNTLALDVQPVDVPGQSGLKKERRNGAAGENNNGGDGLIGENVTMLMSAGWDFTYPDGIRDRNTGPWRDVEVFATGDVILEHPFVVSRLPLPDTSTSGETVSVDVYNASHRQQEGILQGSIKEPVMAGHSEKHDMLFSKKIILQPLERKTIVFTPDQYGQLRLFHPKLWWPVNKGEQNLYSLDLSFGQGKAESHHIAVRFGVREISSDQHTSDSSRRFLVNGSPVFIRGSNWIPEGMLRNTVKRTNAELWYTRQAGINLLRLWGGGIAESDYFYQLCDELGIMVWSEFWLTGDTRFPDDSPLYLQNLQSTVQRIRTHASLAYYVSANEAKEVAGAGELIRSLDSSRGYQQQSECCGVHDGSPYKYENPMTYFENTASSRGSRVDGFNPEYGTPCLPTVECLREMMPARDLWPINDSVWDYMDGGGFHQMTTKYRQAVDQFGPSASIEAFAKKAQFVGAMNYRSIWEVWNRNKFAFGDRWASGFLFWYHNSPVPQVAGRLYDWSLEPTAALYYSQNGLQPLHPQFDYLKNTVSVYNDYRKAFRHYRVVATVYDIHSKKAYTRGTRVDIPSDGFVKDAITLDFPSELSPVHFIRLVLQDSSGHPVASSFYWRSKDRYQGASTMTGPAVSGFQQLNELEKVQLETTSVLVMQTGNRQQGNRMLRVKLSNRSPTLSFFTQLKLQDGKGKSILPAFYSDNFINLLPGESRTISIRFDREDVTGKEVDLLTDGWNAIPQKKKFTL